MGQQQMVQQAAIQQQQMQQQMEQMRLQNEANLNAQKQQMEAEKMRMEQQMAMQQQQILQQQQQQMANMSQPVQNPYYGNVQNVNNVQAPSYPVLNTQDVIVNEGVTDEKEPEIVPVMGQDAANEVFQWLSKLKWSDI